MTIPNTVIKKVTLMTPEEYRNWKKKEQTDDSLVEVIHLERELEKLNYK